MKTTSHQGFQLAVVTGLAGVGMMLGMQMASGQPEVRTSEIMKAKLSHAQAILESIATEDFAKIQTNAQKLSRLSQGAGWRARQTPEYDLFTTEFRRRADALAQAAEERNIDSATLAYTQMTFTCVSCHKHMRGKKVVSLDTDRVPF